MPEPREVKLSDAEIQALNRAGIREGDTVGSSVLTPEGTFRPVYSPSTLASSGTTPAQIQQGTTQIQNQATNLSQNSSSGLVNPSSTANNYRLPNGQEVYIGDPLINRDLLRGATYIGSGSNPLISTSGAVVNADNQTRQNVNSFDDTAARQASNDYIAGLDTEYKRLEQRRQQEVDAINAQYEREKAQTETAQANERGTTQNSLLRIGGFLGESGSGTGALLKLNEQHRTEIQNLSNKRDAAIAAARNAIDDKQFAIARLKAAEVKDIEKEINDRKNTFFEQTVKLQEEQRKRESDLVTAYKEKEKASIESAKNIAPSVFNSLTGDQEQDAKTIKDISDQYGIDPNVLSSEVNRYRNETQKALPDIIKEYEEAVNKGYFNGDFFEYQKVRGAARRAPASSRVLGIKDAVRIGLPELAGVEEKELILSLISEQPPEWFRVKAEESAQQSLLPGVLQEMWNNFKTDPEIKSYTRGERTANVDLLGELLGNLPAPVPDQQ